MVTQQVLQLISPLSPWHEYQVLPKVSNLFSKRKVWPLAVKKVCLLAVGVGIIYFKNMFLTIYVPTQMSSNVGYQTTTSPEGGEGGGKVAPAHPRKFAMMVQS